MKKMLLTLVLAIVSISMSGPVEDLKPGEWYEVPNSHLKSVAPSGVEPRVIDPWCGGAFDTKRDNLIVWGGGHGDYSGNEIYLFSLDSLKWTRVNNPSNPPAVDVPYASDGGPCSRHTYDYIQYIASIDRFCSFGGAGFYQSGQTGTNHTDVFNFDTKKWTMLADCPSSGIGAFSAYDQSTGHAWCHGTITSSQTVLSEFDPVNNVWTSRTGYNDDLQYNYTSTAAIDPLNKKFIAIGKGKVLIWTIATPAKVTRHDLSGGPAAASPGFDYDIKAKKMIAWSRGQSVSVFDGGMETWSAASGSGVSPTAPAEWGTFGRWRYSPNKNVFVLVNNINENVFLYRFSSGSGTAAKNAPGLATSGSNRIRITSNVSPLSGEIRINLAPDLPRGQLAVFDATGKQVADLTDRIKNGAVCWKSDVRVGIYFVRLSSGIGHGAVKLVIF